MNKGYYFEYYFAYWDECYRQKRTFVEVCKNVGAKYDCIDCESKEGVELSIKNGVKLCPTVIAYYNGKEIDRFRGGDVWSKVYNIVKTKRNERGSSIYGRV